MKKTSRFLLGALLAALVLTAAIALNTQLSKAATPANATDGVAIGTLAENGLLKLNGRTKVESDYLVGEFSGTGFSAMITATEDTELVLRYDTNIKGKISILIDGEYAATELYPATPGFISADVKAGTHELTVVKESQINNSATTYTRFKSLTFKGTVDGPAAEKARYIEVIGDSYACGDGAAAKYDVGEAWTEPRDDMASYSFGWFLAQSLDADLSIVARGGAGLDGGDPQQAVNGGKTVFDFYEYTDYADQAAGAAYVPTRTPDLVIIELGANDSKEASTVSAWVNKAKELTLKVKALHGDVPIVFISLQGHRLLYQGLRNLLDSDAELQAYGNISAYMTYLEKNGSAALSTQTGGHGSRNDQERLAFRIKNYIETEGILPEETAETAYTDYIYYLSQNGNDSNNGLTPETARLTLESLVAKIKADHTDYKALPNDVRVIIRVTGTVLASNTQNLVKGFESTTRLLHKDGSPAELIIETYQYDGTNRAVLQCTFSPKDAGSASACTYTKTTFRNVQIYFTSKGTNSKYPISTIYMQGDDLTFDNTTIRRPDGVSGGVNVSATGFSYSAALHKGFISDGVEQVNTITFMNGVYGTATGFGAISAVRSSSYWANAANGGSKLTAPYLTARILGEKGAVFTGTVNAFGNTLGVKEAIIELRTGSVLNANFVGTLSGDSSTRKNLIGNVKVILSGGHINGAFAMVGNYVNLTGDTIFEMSGGEIRTLPGTTENNSSIAMGGGYVDVTITGSAYKTMTGGTIYVTTGSQLSYIHLSGKSNNVITGDSVNAISNVTIFMGLQDGGTTDVKNSIYFGVSGGAIKGTLRNEITGGLFDTCLSNASGGAYHFGGQSVAQSIAHLENRIGDPKGGDENVGPVFSTIPTAFGSGWGQFGVQSYTKAAVADADEATTSDIVIDTKIYGGYYTTAKLLPDGNISTANGYYPYTKGSAEIEIYNGMFTSTLNLKSGGQMYGHISFSIYGGYYTDINLLAGTATLVTDGLDFTVYDLTGYGKAVSKEYTIGKISAGTLRAVNGGDALSVAIHGGNARATLALTGNAYITGTKRAVVDGGRYKTVTSDYAEGFVSALIYQTLPAASLLASGVEAKTFSQTFDRYFTGEIGFTHAHCLCGGTLSESESHSCEDVIWTPLYSPEDVKAIYAGTAPTEGWYYLTRDILLAENIKGADGKTIHLCLNGHTLEAPVESRAYIAFITNSSTGTMYFSLSDCGTTGTVLGGYKNVNCAAIGMFGNGAFDLYGGTITGGRVSDISVTSNTGDGGNVTIGAKATFNMYGGAITDGISFYKGGNLSVDGIFNMYGGTISGGRTMLPDGVSLSSWRPGGNVAVNGTMNMYDGTIEGGTANYGGNIQLGGSSVFNFKGGTITGGKTTNGSGGNILVDSAASFFMTGGTISNGVAATSGGNILNQGSFSIKGGTITGGKANTNGGNISSWRTAAATAEFPISDCTISGGEANIGGNISVHNTIVTILGNVLIENGKAVPLTGVTTGQHGGNVYISLATVNIKGGTIKNGKSGSIGGANISMTGAGTLNISGGSIENGTQVNGSAAVSIYLFAAAERFNMTGGAIIQPDNGGAALNINVAKSGASVTGGYIKGTVAGSVKHYIAEAFVASTISADYLTANRKQIRLTPAVTAFNTSFNYEIAEAYAVETVSETTAGITGVAALSGGGIYRANTTATLEAPDLSDKGYTFMGWYLASDRNTRLTDALQHSFTPAADAQYIALYRFGKQYVTLTVDASAFTVQEGEKAPVSYTGKQSLQFASGAELLVTYTDDLDIFFAWINTNRKYVSREAEYHFILTVDKEIAVETKPATTEETVTILFTNGSGQILYTYFEVPAELPEVPARIGKVGAWSMDKAAIEAAVSAGEKMIEVTARFTDDPVVATYAVSIQKVTATSIDGTWTNAGSAAALPSVTLGSRVLLTAEELDGYVFACFALKDAEENVKILSYASEIATIFSADTTVYAVYTAAAQEALPIIALDVTTSVSGTSINTKYTATRSIPESYTLVEHGILYAVGIYTEDTIYLGATGVRTATSDATGLIGTVSLNIGAVPAGYAITARGYMILMNASGEPVILYSDVIAVNNMN